MSTPAITAALVAGWVLAAITLWMAGAHNERVHRFDGCEFVNLTMHQSAWLCPAEKPSPAKPRVDEPGSQA